MTDFAQFYRDHYRLVVTIAEHRLGSLQDAEDVASETFRIVFQRHASGGDLTLPWLYGVVRNLVGNEYRRRTRSRALHDRLATEWHETEPEASDAVEMVREALTLLPTAQQELLTMIYWDELTMAEAAAILKCRVGAVRVRVMRARRALRSMIERLNEDPDPGVAACGAVAAP
ncbi:RNA polymerase sigma factor [Microbacterium luticocti]|uniref:RNA polymerase sigma factor n=1 Tax=Microbacterium luticocti TaxID=451764 RepID=UPI000416AA7F|nr:sigma-70 family RNA polymerase sigma factor [Microbacterium luticocti]